MLLRGFLPLFVPSRAPEPPRLVAAPPSHTRSVFPSPFVALAVCRWSRCRLHLLERPRGGAARVAVLCWSGHQEGIRSVAHN